MTVGCTDIFSCNDTAYNKFSEMTAIPRVFIDHINRDNSCCHIAWKSDKQALVLETRWDDQKTAEDNRKSHTFLYSNGRIYHSSSYLNNETNKIHAFAFRVDYFPVKVLEEMTKTLKKGITNGEQEEIGHWLKFILNQFGIIVDVDHFIITKVNRTSEDIPSNEMYLIGE